MFPAYHLSCFLLFTLGQSGGKFSGPWPGQADLFHPICVSSKHLSADFIATLCISDLFNFVPSKLSAWLWPGKFLGLLTHFPLSLFCGYLSYHYTSNIFCRTKRLAVNRRETEKFFAAVQIVHVLVARLALQNRSHILWKMVMKYSLEVLQRIPVSLW